MPADPQAAGRKGGAAKTPAQQAARKRNGFQPRKPAAEQPPDLQPGCGCVQPAARTPKTAVPGVLIVAQPKEGK